MNYLIEREEKNLVHKTIVSLGSLGQEIDNETWTPLNKLQIYERDAPGKIFSRYFPHLYLRPVPRSIARLQGPRYQNSIYHIPPPPTPSSRPTPSPAPSRAPLLLPRRTLVHHLRRNSFIRKGGEFMNYARPVFQWLWAGYIVVKRRPIFLPPEWKGRDRRKSWWEVHFQCFCLLSGSISSFFLFFSIFSVFFFF